MNIFHKTQKKETRKLPMTGKVKKGFRYYCAAVLSVTAVFAMSTTAFAASDPLTVVKTRLSEDEYADFTARLAPYGISQSEFLRQAIRDRKSTRLNSSHSH